MKVTDITPDRIQGYKGFSKQELQAELNDLNSLIELESENALLYSARARVKVLLNLDYKSDILKRFTLDKDFVERATYVNAELLGTSSLQEKSKLVELMNKIQIAEDKKTQLLKDFDIANITENNLDEYLEKYSSLFDERDYSNLEKIFKNLVEKFPQNSKVFFNFGSILVKLEKLEDALACYQKAEKLDPPVKELLFHIAGTLYDLGRYAEAYNYLANKSSHEIPALQYQMRCSIKLGNHEQAKLIYQQILTANPDYELPDNVLKLHLRPDLLEDEKALRNAAYKADYAEFKRLTDKGVSVNNQGDTTSRSPLMWLFIGNGNEKERLKILDILITKKANNYPDTDGNTAFHYIFLSNNFKLFKKIPNDLIDKSTLFVRNNKRETPLDILNKKLSALKSNLDSNVNIADVNPTLIERYNLLKECRLKIDEITLTSTSSLQV